MGEKILAVLSKILYSLNVRKQHFRISSFAEQCF